ncbi:MAG: hypothetical protein AAF572_18175 [Cyanobacteria bacterium P01_B01_bin.77]
MKRLTLLSNLILASVIGSVIGTVIPAQAQVFAGEKQASGGAATCVATTPGEQIALNAAKNEARQMAEAVNGGLIVYRAEPAMHGAAIAAPCEMLGPAVWRFTIRGGEPTAVAIREQYTTLSVVTVAGTGRDRSVTLDYNGPMRGYRR